MAARIIQRIIKRKIALNRVKNQILLRKDLNRNNKVDHHKYNFDK